MDSIRRWNIDPATPIIEETLPARSITVVATFDLQHADNGIIHDAAK
jgi:hypothetical protein